MKLEENSTIKSENLIIEHVAHDFKAMLSQVYGLNAILRKRTKHLEDDEINKIISYIDIVCKQGHALTTDLMEACALETTDEMRFEVCSLNQLIEEQAKLFKLQAQEKNIDFRTCIPGKQFFFEIDKYKFIRVLNNLFSNALRFTERNGQIHIVLKDGGGKAFIEIRDSGSGIPGELQKEIFKKYSGAKSYGRQGGRQTGLGLYIVKQIIELHKGKVGFTTGPKGTTFMIELNSGIIL